LVGVRHTIRLPDKLETPLWIPVVFYAVLDATAPELFLERVRRAQKYNEERGKPGMGLLLPSPGNLMAVADEGREFTAGGGLKWTLEQCRQLLARPTKAEVTALADAIDQEADRIEGERGDDLLDRLADILTLQGLRIVQYLWNRKHSTGYETLKETCWKNEPTDEAIQKALKRVQGKLNEDPSLGVTIEIHHAKRRVKLDHPPDK